MTELNWKGKLLAKHALSSSSVKAKEFRQKHADHRRRAKASIRNTDIRAKRTDKALQKAASSVAPAELLWWESGELDTEAFAAQVEAVLNGQSYPNILASDKLYYQTLAVPYAFWLSLQKQSAETREQTLRALTKVQLPSGKPLRVTKKSEDIHVILKAFLGYPDGRGGAQKLSRDSLALRYLRGERVKPTELAATGKKKGEGLEVWADRFRAENRKPRKDVSGAIVGATETGSASKDEDEDEDIELETSSENAASNNSRPSSTKTKTVADADDEGPHQSCKVLNAAFAVKVTDSFARKIGPGTSAVIAYMDGKKQTLVLKAISKLSGREVALEPAKQLVEELAIAAPSDMKPFLRKDKID